AAVAAQDTHPAPPWPPHPAAYRGGTRPWIEGIEKNGPQAPREVPAGRTGTADGQGRSRRRGRRVSYVRQVPAGMQIGPPTQQAAAAQKDPAGQSALLVQCVLPSQFSEMSASAEPRLRARRAITPRDT